MDTHNIKGLGPAPGCVLAHNTHPVLGDCISQMEEEAWGREHSGWLMSLPAWADTIGASIPRRNAPLRLDLNLVPEPHDPSSCLGQGALAGDGRPRQPLIPAGGGGGWPAAVSCSWYGAIPPADLAGDLKARQTA